MELSAAGPESPKPRSHAGLVAAGSALLFAALYIVALVATILLLVAAGATGSLAVTQWGALAAAVLATILAGLLVDRRFPDAGLRTPPRPLVRSLAGGMAIATLLVGGGHLLIVATTDLTTRAGPGFPLRAALLMLLPAAIHEELVFRGWAFQKLARWSPAVAVLIGSLLFAVLHGSNPAVGTLALINIALAGAILSLAYLLFRNLWGPIALHYAWNVFSGPVLGYEVSGWHPPATLLTQKDPGPALLTGGDFGIEASVWLTVLQLLLTVALLLAIRNGSLRRGVDRIRFSNREGKESE